MNDYTSELWFSYFHDPKKGIFNVTPKVNIDFDKLIQIYRSNYVKEQTELLRACTDPEQRDRLKKTLPYITPYGTFNKRRLTENIRKHNKICAIDLDHLTDDDVKEVKKVLCQCSACILCAISPRGKGVKALILIEVDYSTSKPYDVLKFNLNVICDRLKITRWIDKVDLAQFNLVQPLFIAYDDELYFNEIPDNRIKLKPLPPPPPIKPVTIRLINSAYSTRIEIYLRRATQNVCNELSKTEIGERHRKIAKVIKIASITHYAEHMRSEIRTELLNAVISMYGTQKQAEENHAISSFDAAWNQGIEKEAQNEKIEEIIKELNELTI